MLELVVATRGTASLLTEARTRAAAMAAAVRRLQDHGLTAAVQRSGKDPSLRIAYPLDRFKVELAKDLRSRILTLMTPDGFAVSFCLSETQRRQIGSADPSASGLPASSTHLN